MNETTYTTTKHTVECYKIRSNRHSWADITIDAKDHTGRIQIVSDFGDWQFFWGACGKPFKKFLQGLNIDYTANKFNANKWFDLKGTVKYLTNRIEEYAENQAQKQALLFELYSIENCSDKNEFQQEIQGCYLLMKMENQFPEFQYGIHPGFQRFWNELWPVFLQELKKEEIEASIKRVQLKELSVGSEFKYNLQDKGIYKVVEIESDVWIKTKRMCGRNSGDFPKTKVYPLNQ